MNSSNVKDFFCHEGKNKLQEFFTFASTASAFEIVSNGLGNLIEGTSDLVNEVNMSRLLSEKFCNMTAYSSPSAFQDWLLLKQSSGNQALANALNRVQGDYGEVELLRQLQGQIRSMLFKPMFPVNDFGRVANNTPGIDIEIRNRITDKLVERIQVKTVSDPGNINNIIDSLVNNKDFLPTDTLAGPKELIDAAKATGLKNKMIIVGDVNDTKALRESLQNKILDGKILTNYTSTEVLEKMGQGAIVGCAIRVGVSSLTNYIKFLHGNITGREAICNVSEDGIKGAVSGAALTGASIIFPAGVLGVAGGIAIGMYVDATLTNILDEIFGKGAYRQILISSGYVMGTSLNLSQAIEQFEQDRLSVQNNTVQTAVSWQKSDEKQNEFERIMGGIK